MCCHQRLARHPLNRIAACLRIVSLFAACAMGSCSVIADYEDYSDTLAATSTVGESCSSTADCEGSICHAGSCRRACEIDEDCGGGVCLGGRGCRLDDEEACDTPGAPCDNGALRCGLDLTCRTPCSDDDACGSRRGCIERTCVGREEADADDLGWFSCSEHCEDDVLVTCNTELPGENRETCESEELCAAVLDGGDMTMGCGEDARQCADDGRASCDDDFNVLFCTAGVLQVSLGPCATRAQCEATAVALEADPTTDACISGCEPEESSCVVTTDQLEAVTCNAAQTGFDADPCPEQCAPLRGCIELSVDATEVSRADYDSFLATSPALETSDVCAEKATDHTPDSGCLDLLEHDCDEEDCGALPQVCVDWCDARAYCDSVGERLCGRIGGGPLTGDDSTDPNLSEWHNACSSGGQRDTPTGERFDINVCTGREVDGQRTTDVSGSDCRSNLAGYTAYEHLVGNAAEWEDACEDVGGTELCSVRGGSFDSARDSDLECSTQELRPVLTRSPSIGFRCCG